jgi:hypothetical protein
MTKQQEEEFVFDKLREAAELYEVYATLAETAEFAVLGRPLSALSSEEPDDLASFRPLPLTIALRTGN